MEGLGDSPDIGPTEGHRQGQDLGESVNGHPAGERGDHGSHLGERDGVARLTVEAIPDRQPEGAGQPMVLAETSPAAVAPFESVAVNESVGPHFSTALIETRPTLPFSSTGVSF